jgi:hypothetical protein
MGDRRAAASDDGEREPDVGEQRPSRRPRWCVEHGSDELVAAARGVTPRSQAGDQVGWHPLGQHQARGRPLPFLRCSVASTATEHRRNG